MKNIFESDNRLVGHSISFIDIDETTFHTYAKVKVIDEDGNVVRVLDNKQFNTDVLKHGEKYDFSEFQDSRVFNKTSEPIEPIVNKIQKIIDSIKKNNKFEKVIFLTARSDFDNKELFLKTFKSNGIDVEIPNVYIERSGNLTNIKSVAERKRYVILKYLKSGEFTAVRMIDDDIHNLEVFNELGKEINSGKFNILQTVKKRYPRVRKIYFYPLLVLNNGKIKNFTKALKESLIPLNDDENPICLTASVYELINYAKGFDKLRVVYDVTNGVYICADGYDYIHTDLKQEYFNNYGYDNSYYGAEQFEEIDFAMSGNTNSDMEFADDNYNYMYNFNNELYIYARNTLIEKTPLYRKLVQIFNKPNIQKLLTESMIMERLFPEMDEFTFQNLKRATVDYGKPVNSYTKWLGNLILSGKMKSPFVKGGTLYDIRDAIDTHKKLKQAGLVKPIMNYNSWDELVNEIEEIINKQNYKSNSEKDELAKKGAKIVNEHNDWVLLNITTWEAAKKYGKGTRWCVSSNISREYFDRFEDNESSSKFSLYFLINKKTGQKIAYDVSLYYEKRYKNGKGYDINFWNEKDNRIAQLITYIEGPTLVFLNTLDDSDINIIKWAVSHYYDKINKITYVDEFFY